jgi:ribose transport system substrate-binding protein
MRTSRSSTRAVAGLAAVSALVLAGCANSSTSISSGGSTATTGPPRAQLLSSSRAEVGQASAAIAPYVGHPSAFPATVALSKRPAAGSTFIYLQCSTPICAQIGQVLHGPTAALGVTLRTINAGSTATSSQAAAAAAGGGRPAVRR